MPVTDTLKAVPGQFFDALDTTQQLILANTSAFVTSARSLTPETPTLPFADRLPDPVVVTGGAYDFAAKLLASQRDFSLKLLETWLPATPAAKPAPKTAAKA